MIIFIIALLTLSSSVAFGGQAHIASASNFNTTLPAVISAFEAQSDHTVSVSYASSGKLYAQIVHGAPFTIFLSADSIKPQLLADKGFGNSDTIFTYAAGELVLWLPEQSQSGNSNHIMNADQLRQQLTSKQIKRIAIANPRHAPYGVAAKEVLYRLGVLPALQKKLVTGENISQAFQFALSGNAEAALVAKSQVIAFSKTIKNNQETLEGHTLAIPKALYSTIRQDAIFLKNGEDNIAARDFYRFLQSSKGQKIISQHGYLVNHGDKE